MTFKALDLFCGAGGASMGLHRAGFEVTGVDIAPQPHYPFAFIQADALAFPLDGYDFIWASPPCQAYSRTKSMHDKRHPELIWPVRKRLAATGATYVIENVVGAPLFSPLLLCGTMFGLRVLRHRLFESNVYLMAPPHPRHLGITNSHRGMSTGGAYVTVAGHNFHVAEARQAMGIDWTGQKGLSQAIPPAYSQFIGTQIIDYLSRQAA